MRKYFTLFILLFVLILLATTGWIIFSLNDTALPTVTELPELIVDELAAWLPIANEKPQVSNPEPLVKVGAQPGVALTKAGILAWTNNQRRQNDLGPLAASELLDQVAQIRLQDMFDNQYFAHNSPITGEGAAEVAITIGYEAIATGENIALGNFDGDQGIVQDWMDSPGHRTNIVSTQFTQLGVAATQGEFEGEIAWIGVQIFGRPASDCPKPDDALRVQLDNLQAQITVVKPQLDSLYSELNKFKPGKRRNIDVDEYNQKVEQYNSLAEQTNKLVEESKQLSKSYNTQVEAFNGCIAS